MYLNRFKCITKMCGGFLIFILFCASCKLGQHLSQKNLSSAFKVSVELKFFKQLVIELFCSISRLKSKNVSSLAVTVSHLKHFVSFVSIP
ncbi:hypothetical protein HanPSC8_Chr10g0428461 [Helianthus annuus]|nr:hypothetical protein HanPSC8_Chr10g0428461 [Helianthus annuus]